MSFILYSIKYNRIIAFLMSSSKIQLKPVGKLPLSTKNLLKMKRTSFDPDREFDKFEG